MTSVEKYESFRAQPEQLITFLVERDREIEKLQNIIANSNKKLFGPKTEKLTSDQLKFSFEVTSAPEQLSLEEVVVERHTRTVQKGRQPLPNELPREEIVYTPEQTNCLCCNTALVKIGEERSEELEKVPASLKVIVHIREKFACSACKSAGILVPPLPASVMPLERSRPGPGLLADIIVSKYVDHLPLYRQEQMYQRLGIELKRQRMCDWIAAVTELLMPLYQALKLQILNLPYIHADETTIKVQDGEEEGKCHTGYLWGLFGAPNLVWFHYAETRAGSVPKELLKGFSGAVHTDAYAGYNQIFLPDRCVRVACFAHIRRAFLEVKKTSEREAQQVLTLIAQIYKLESGTSDPQKRFQIRQSRSKALFDKLFTFLKATAERTLPKAPLIAALNYALNQEREVYRILENGAFELDNNPIERQIRPIAIGRKNYLFAGSHAGAHRAAVLYSLLGTCKLTKVNPWQWLKDVIVRVSADRTVKAQQLLPQYWRNSGTQNSS